MRGGGGGAVVPVGRLMPLLPRGTRTRFTRTSLSLIFFPLACACITEGGRSTETLEGAVDGHAADGEEEDTPRLAPRVGDGTNTRCTM